MEPKCTFCDYDSKKPRIVAETPNFYALPTVGQISDGGHMLIVTRKHHPCLGSMEEELFPEYEAFVDRVKAAVTTRYGKPILFEHGILGQSISHAHLQMMPSMVDLFPFINRDFKVFRELSSVRELRELHRTKGVYLFYQDLNDKKFGFILDSFPQYLRIVAAEAIGKPKRGNWREWTADPDCKNLDDRLIEETVNQLRKELS